MDVSDHSPVCAVYNIGLFRPGQPMADDIDYADGATRSAASFSGVMELTRFRMSGGTTEVGGFAYIPLGAHCLFTECCLLCRCFAPTSRCCSPHVCCFRCPSRTSTTTLSNPSGLTPPFRGQRTLWHQFHTPRPCPPSCTISLSRLVSLEQGGSRLAIVCACGFTAFVTCCICMTGQTGGWSDRPCSFVVVPTARRRQCGHHSRRQGVPV